MTQREVIQALTKAGWREVKGGGKGSHRKMAHPETHDKVTIPHGEIAPGTLRSIERKTGVKLK